MCTLVIVIRIMLYHTRRAIFKNDHLIKVEVVAGGNGQCVCELTVTEDDQNRGGTLHGGMTATLVDAVSTWALLSSEKQVAGVSVDMGIS